MWTEPYTKECTNPAEQFFLLRVKLCQVSRPGLELADFVLQVVVLLRQAAQLIASDLLQLFFDKLFQFFKKIGHPRPPFSFTLVFSNKHYSFNNKYMWKMSIQYTVLGFEHTTFQYVSLLP